MLTEKLGVFDFDPAALASAPLFTDDAHDAVVCDNLADIHSSQLEEIVSRYEKHGFAILELRPPLQQKLDPQQVILDIADHFGLGEPFIPPLYLKGDYKAPRFNRISVECNGNVRHPSFERTLDLPLHCDGTLQPIGLVKTSLLFCESEAPSGGETVLFNSAAAFAELTRINAESALALMEPDVLRRTANINGSKETLVGPAFKIQDHKLLCCYTVADTDEWQPTDRSVKALQEALRFMKEVSDTSNAASRYHLTFTLKANQAIFMDNTRISHGRKEYQNSLDKVRILYRGLFLTHPTAGVDHAL